MPSHTNNPYAPPETNSNPQPNTQYLEQDGYSHKGQLIANQHFKSPPICAKLGTPIPPETNTSKTEITVTRTTPLPRILAALASLAGFMLILLFCLYGTFYHITPKIVAYLLITKLIKHLCTKPYKIPFYLSPTYTRIRSRRIKTFAAIAIILTPLQIYAIIQQSISISLPTLIIAIITYALYTLKTTYFIVTQTIGEYHYITGVHPNLLQTLHPLPATQQSP